jgi:hypothetical protein
VARSHPKLTKEALAEAITEAARCCGARRHTLEPIPPPLGAPRPKLGSLLCQRCVHCGTLRYDTVSRLTGEILSTKYDRPFWYEQALEERHIPAWWRATFWDTLSPEFFLDAEHIQTESDRARVVGKRVARKTPARKKR